MNPAQFGFRQLGERTVVLAPKYESNWLINFLVGKGYRQLWTTPVRLPVLDLKRTAGGLTPDKLGGGAQTTSLHLEGSQGREFRLRLLEKDESVLIPAGWRGAVFEWLAEESGAAFNPYGAAAAAALARSAGVLHVEPILVYVPDDARLGAFRSLFAGQPALLEWRADEADPLLTRLACADRVVDTEEMMERLTQGSSAAVDRSAYLRARLLDMLIGDRDRHGGNWRWAEVTEGNSTRYLPIPMDRDWAFSRFDGFVYRLARFVGGTRMRLATNFDEGYGDLTVLNRQGMGLDRQLTRGVPRAEWIAEAERLRRDLSDRVIADAISEWPAVVFDLIGEDTVKKLIVRRDELPALAARYFDVLW